MDTLRPSSSFWKPVKIGLGVFVFFIMGYWLISPGQSYEAPVNGQYNSPANTSYEDAVNKGAEPDPLNDKSTSEQLGEETGKAWNGLKDSGEDFLKGLQNSVE